MEWKRREDEGEVSHMQHHPAFLCLALMDQADSKISTEHEIISHWHE